MTGDLAPRHPAGSEDRPSKTPTRLADGLGRGSDLDRYCYRTYAPSSVDAEDIGSPVAVVRKHYGFRLRSKERAEFARENARVKGSKRKPLEEQADKFVYLRGVPAG